MLYIITKAFEFRLREKKYIPQANIIQATCPKKFIYLKIMSFEIKPFVKKRVKIIDGYAHNYMHLKHFKSCQLLGPSTLTATHKNVLVLCIFNLKSREAWSGAASTASVIRIWDIFLFFQGTPFLYWSFWHKS